MKKKELLDFLQSLKKNLANDGIVSLGLFGSYANDTQAKGSDIDILIETTDTFRKRYNGWDAFVYIDENIRGKIAKKFHKRVDIFDKNSNSCIKNKILDEVYYV